MRLGEQIAVLDGLSVIDPSVGVNYGGGSNYPDSGGWPLLPSSSGLADFTANDMQQLPTSVFQKLLNALGEKIKADGQYGPGTANAFMHLVTTSGGAGEDAVKGAKAIIPFASGTMLFVPTKIITGMVKVLQKKTGAAVLSGLGGFAATMHGRRMSPPVSLPTPPMAIPNSYATMDVVNASNGANYSGGSTYPDEHALPLMTSSIGLAGMSAVDQDLMQRSDVETRRNVINPSGGSNRSGGSDYYPGAPLLTSSVGLSGRLTTASRAAAQNSIPNNYASMDVVNASGGANRSGGSTYPDEHAIPLMTSSIGLAGLSSLQVINASNGANYSGGANYPDEHAIPLLTSSIGLAGLAAAADKFAAMRGKHVRMVATGDMLTDARRKLWAVFASLRGVLDNPKETAANKQKAVKYTQALQTAIRGMRPAMGMHK